ncbi:MAG: VCBS repeat-containing protein [Myxococcales bacterium]|nr:VCBS repeat-containing protein [Myxococcales bacterium]
MDSLELRKVSSVAALALVLGAASCSGDSGRGDGSESATTTATTQGTSGTTGDATGSTSGGGSGSTGTGTTSGGGETVGTTSGSTGATTSGGVECTDHRQCGDGKCIAGSCCAIEDACGDVACCGGGEVCLFDQCVVPGAPCKSANDCAEGEYCEPALGEGEGDTTGGDTTGGDMACTQSIPDAGYCLKLPEVCGPGQDPMKDGCVAACEYYPDAGKLNATLKWQWGLYAADEFSKFSDVWSTPTVGRIYDANCDGKVDDTDPPNVVFVSGNSNQTCCSCGNEPISTCRTGILRVLDGASGQEIWSLDKAKAGNYGFAGVSVALGDIDNDGDVEIITATGDGFVAAISNEGVVEAISDLQIDGQNAGAFGWGGGLSVADMDGDGYPEIAFGRTLFSTKNGIKREWVGAGGIGGGNTSALSHMVDLDNDGKLELLAGNTAYSADGSIFWQNAGLPDGFTAIGDFDLDGTPEVVLVGNGQVWILQAENGGIDLGPVAIPGGLNGGGPPTVADFDGEPDKRPEIGVAGGAYYAVFKPDYQNSKINIAWQLATKDTSSRVTGSSVFDFEGDGRAEVIYSDECFLWILDGVDGTLRFAEPNTTFTATEAIIVADVDGDGHAEVVRVSNSANWQCNTAPWNQPDPKTGRPPGSRRRTRPTTRGSRSSATPRTRGSAPAPSGTSTPTTSPTSAIPATRPAIPWRPTGRSRPRRSRTGSRAGSTTSGRTSRTAGSSTPPTPRSRSRASAASRRWCSRSASATSASSASPRGSRPRSSRSRAWSRPWSRPSPPPSRSSPGRPRSSR